MEQTNKHYLSHGSEWPEHEDFLIGDQVGLQRLQQAINQALEQGESELDVGDFVGVRRVDAEFFERANQKLESSSEFGFWAFITVIVGIFLVSLVSIISWFF